MKKLLPLLLLILIGCSGDGPYKEYYKNGQLREEGTLKDDKQDGLWKHYYENGKLNYQERYN